MKFDLLRVFSLSLSIYSEPVRAAFPTDQKQFKDKVEVLPFVLELGEVKFSAHDHEVPDEVRVTITGQQIQMSGTKRVDTVRVKGAVTGHHGKIVLIPLDVALSGTLSTKLQSVDTVNTYGIALELASGALKQVSMKLETKTDYTWAITNTGSQWILTVSKAGQPIRNIQAATADVKGFGFYTTLRYPRNKTDLTINVNPLAPK